MQTHRQQLDFQNYTVLIVDDSPANLGVVFDFLDDQGFTIMVAQDGESCLEKVRFRVPDIILLDALMPGLDGFEVCRRLKNDVATGDIPIIFMTGLTGVEDKVRGFQAGAVDYVTKPVQEAELLARLLTHLRIRDLTQNLQQTNRQLEVEIVAHKQTQTTLIEYRDKLEQRVEQRTMEIRAQGQRLRELTARLAEVEESERRRLARELHDRVSQDLGILSIDLNIVRSVLPTETDALLRARLDESLRLIEQIAKHVYDVMADLRSPVLDDYGLVAALNWYCTHLAARTGIEVNVRGPEHGPRFPLAAESTLFRIAQEALTNVAKHANADKINVSVTVLDERARLIVADNGDGFDPRALSTPGDGQGWGLMSMAERAEAIGGTFSIKTRLEQGTQITAEVPV